MNAYHAEENPDKTVRLTPHQYATYNYVWNLSGVEKDLLTIYETRAVSCQQLVEKAGLNHPWRETIQVDGITYTLAYHDCSFSYLEDLAEQLPNTPILLSLRYAKGTDLAVALCSLIKRISVASNLQKYKPL